MIQVRFYKISFLSMVAVLLGLSIVQNSYAEEMLTIGTVKGIGFNQIAEEILTEAYSRMDYKVKFKECG